MLSLSIATAMLMMFVAMWVVQFFLFVLFFLLNVVMIFPL